jgi:hypothetical protein
VASISLVEGTLRRALAVAKVSVAGIPVAAVTQANITANGLLLVSTGEQRTVSANLSETKLLGMIWPFYACDR